MSKYKGGPLLAEIAHLRHRDRSHPVLPLSLLSQYYLLYAVSLLYMLRLVLVTWLMIVKEPATVAPYFTYDRQFAFLNLQTGNDVYFLLVVACAGLSTGMAHYRFYCTRHPLLWEMFTPLSSLFTLESESGGRFSRLSQKVVPSILRRQVTDDGDKSESKGSAVSSLRETDAQVVPPPLHFAHLDGTHQRRVCQISQLYQKAYLCYPYGHVAIFGYYFFIHVHSFAFDPSLSVAFKVASGVDYLLGSTLIFIFVRILLLHYYLIIIVAYLLYQEFRGITREFTQWANRWMRCTRKSEPPCRTARADCPPPPPPRQVFSFLRSEHTRVSLLADYLNQTIVSPFLSTFLLGIFFFNVYNLTTLCFLPKPLAFRLFIALILLIQTLPPTAIVLALTQLNRALFYGASDSLCRVLPRMGLLSPCGRHRGGTAWPEQHRVFAYFQLLHCKRHRFAFSAGIFGCFTQNSVFQFYLIYAAYIMNFTSRFILDKQESN